MGVSAVITAGAAAYSAYSTYEANKRAKKAAQDMPAPVIPPAPDVVAQAQAANLAAQNAAVQTRRRAATSQQRQSTILTSPQGAVGAPGPGRTTLLGL